MEFSFLIHLSAIHHYKYIFFKHQSQFKFKLRGIILKSCNESIHPAIGEC